jgi:hypothetical protein
MSAEHHVRYERDCTDQEGIESVLQVGDSLERWRGSNGRRWCYSVHFSAAKVDADKERRWTYQLQRAAVGRIPESAEGEVGVRAVDLEPHTRKRKG